MNQHQSMELGLPHLAMGLLLFACCALCAADSDTDATAAMPGLAMAAPLYCRPAPNVKTRWYTWENQKGEAGRGGQANHGRKGSPAPHLPAGGSLTFLDVDGPGVVRRIWITISAQTPETLRGLRLEMTWDGAQTPAVSAPIGDFFGHTVGRMVRFQNALFSSPEGRSFNCVIPMPFKKHARMQVVNESQTDVTFFYEVDATLGDALDDDALYFHASWRRENMTTLREDMTILPETKGCGRYLGCLLGMRLNPDMFNFWWGEGEVKVYLDGDQQWPTLCGTGTEDYISTGWGQDQFVNIYQGCPYVSPHGELNTKEAYGFYRLHVPDPVYFHQKIRVTIQNLGGGNGDAMAKCLERNAALKFMKAGDGTEYFTRAEIDADPHTFHLIERQDDYCATAYFYLDRPENGLPPLAPVEQRTIDIPR